MSSLEGRKESLKGDNQLRISQNKNKKDLESTCTYLMFLLGIVDFIFYLKLCL